METTKHEKHFLNNSQRLQQISLDCRKYFILQTRDFPDCSKCAVVWWWNILSF